MKIADVLRTAERLGLPVRRGAARLTLTQASQLRQAYKDRVGIRRPPPLPPAPKDERRRTSRCGCCGLRFEQKESGSELHCELCADHYEVTGEDANRTMARLASHVDLFRGRYERVADIATDREKRMKAALSARDKWMRMLVEVALGHEPEGRGCCCGAPVFPCGTRRQIEMSNFGIYRKIEHSRACIITNCSKRCLATAMLLQTGAG